MSYAHLDDHANEHHKQLEAGPEACWLWACSLMYANRQKARDGFVPAAAVPMLYPFKNLAGLVKKLLKAKLWEEVDGGYLVHDFNDHNATKEQVEEYKRKGRERAAASYSRKKAAKNSSGSSPRSSPEDSEESSPKVLRRSCGEGRGGEEDPTRSNFNSLEGPDPARASPNARVPKPDQNPLSDSELAAFEVGNPGLTPAFALQAINDWLQKPERAGSERYPHQWRSTAQSVVLSRWRDPRRRAEILAAVDGIDPAQGSQGPKSNVQTALGHIWEGASE